jgi:hypothetical protein
LKHLRNYRISTQSQKRNAENKGRPSIEKLAQNIDSLSQDEVTNLNSMMVNYKVDPIKTGFYQKYGYYINYVAVTACIITVSILIQTWWFNRDSNSNKLPQSAPLPPPPKDPRERFIRSDEDKDDS